MPRDIGRKIEPARVSSQAEEGVMGVSLIIDQDQKLNDQLRRTTYQSKLRRLATMLMTDSHPRRLQSSSIIITHSESRLGVRYKCNAQ